MYLWLLNPDWTRSRRKGREDRGMAWGSVLDGLSSFFFFGKVNQDIKVLRGDKRTTKPERWDRKTK